MPNPAPDEKPLVRQPVAIRAGLGKIDLLALCRTCATHFGQHASLRDVQAKLRHIKRLCFGRELASLLKFMSGTVAIRPRSCMIHYKHDYQYC